MSHSVRLCLETQEILGANPGRVGCVSSGLSYTVFQTVQRPVLCSAVYGTVHYNSKARVKLNADLLMWTEIEARLTCPDSFLSLQN